MKIQLLFVKTLSMFVLVVAHPKWNSELKKNGILVDTVVPNDIEAQPFEKIYDEINQEMKHSSDQEKESMVKTLETIYDNLLTFPYETIQIWIKNARYKMNIGSLGSDRRIRAVTATKTLMDSIKEWINWIVNLFRVHILGYKSRTSAEDPNKSHDHIAVRQNDVGGIPFRDPSALKPGSPEAKLKYIKDFKQEWDLSEKIEAVTKLEQLMELQGTNPELKEALRAAVHEIKRDQVGNSVYHQLIVKSGEDPFP